jgi:hypothetical protein
MRATDQRAYTHFGHHAGEDVRLCQLAGHGQPVPASAVLSGGAYSRSTFWAPGPARRARYGRQAKDHHRSGSPSG